MRFVGGAAGLGWPALSLSTNSLVSEQRFRGHRALASQHAACLASGPGRRSLSRDTAGQPRSVDIFAYCLMINHVHLVLVPSTSQGLHRMLKPLHTRYAQNVNRAMGKTVTGSDSSPA